MDYPMQEIKIPENEREKYRSCDVCGFRYPRSMTKRNQGRWVGPEDDDLPDKARYRKGGVVNRE